jgi:YaiO family outer membrane protein
LLLLAASPIYALSTQNVLEQSRTLAAQQKYEEALSVLQKSELENPKDIDIKLAIIRILSWQGHYDAAEEKLGVLENSHVATADVQLLRANLAGFKAAIADRWQVDVGYEQSDFSRVPQTPWNQKYLQITQVSNKRQAILYGGVKHYDQFGTSDTEYELGTTQKFTDNFNGYAGFAFCADTDFRPKYRVSGGSAISWFTLDTRYDVYDSATIIGLNPGLRMEPVVGWLVAVRKIGVFASNASSVYGDDYRLDGTIMEGLRFYTGFADAPETVAAVTVRTKTWFSGISWDATPYMTLRFSYAQDDRENSYIRKVINVSASYRF